MLGLFGIIGDFLGNRHERKMREAEIEADLVKSGRKSTEDTWKDEYLTVLVTAPFTLLFVFVLVGWDEGIERLKLGFEILNEFPVWYLELLKITVLAGLGILGVVKPGLRFGKNDPRREVSRCLSDSLLTSRTR